MKEKTQQKKFQSRMHLDNGADYEIFHYVDDENLHVALHSHDFYEFYFLISGNLSYQIMENFFVLKPGDVLLININQPHRPIPIIGGRAVPYDRIVLRVSRDILKQLSTNQSDLTECFQRESYAVYNFPPDTQNNIRLLLSKLLSVQEQSGFGNELIYKAYLIELFVLINRYTRDKTLLTFNNSVKKSQIIEMVKHYIAQNLDRALTVDKLAEHVYLSKYYLMRTFKNMTGVSVYQYILQKRLVTVCDLITNGVPITSAYQQCGFGDYSCFFRAFRKHFGYTPKKYLQFVAASQRPLEIPVHGDYITSE